MAAAAEANPRGLGLDLERGGEESAARWRWKKRN
jgi:hypothetical protein